MKNIKLSALWTKMSALEPKNIKNIVIMDFNGDIFIPNRLRETASVVQCIA